MFERFGLHRRGQLQGVAFVLEGKIHLGRPASRMITDE